MKEYFNIDGKNIFLTKTLIDFNNFPVFFLCNDEENSLYISLCADIDNLVYMIVPVTKENTNKMLNAKITMREFMTSSDFFWEVNLNTGKNAKKNIEEIDKSVLPLEDALFELVNEDLKEFAQKFSEEQSLASKIFVTLQMAKRKMNTKSN